jgi:hypothetical protein
MNENGFEKWFTENPTFVSFGEYFAGYKPPYIPFHVLLDLKDENLKPFTKNALEFLKTHESANELNWGFRAYSQFQDLLGITLSNNSPVWNRHYCYYESLVYLRESIVTWLDQNVLAAMVLLRPFLELSVFHLYWYLRCEQNDYDDFYLWLEGKKGKPPFKSQLDFVFDNLSTKDLVSAKRLNKTKLLLNNLYKGTSTYNHTPKIDESVVSWGGGAGNVSLSFFLFYLTQLNLILRQLVYLYVLAYPMSLIPLDRHNKWGYGGPVGLFFDLANFAVINEYLGSDNIQKIKIGFPKLQEGRDLLLWFEEQPDLSESEIENTWKEFISDKPNSDANKKEQRIAIFKSHFRGLGWFVNYFHEPSKTDDEISDEKVEKIWKQINNW